MNEQQFLEKMKPVFVGNDFILPQTNLSPQERQQQRLAFRNNRTFYTAACAKTEKRMISMYRPDSGYTVYDQKEWRGDDWDATEYGQDIDLHRTFTEQFAQLMKQVPRINLINTEHLNSEYCNFSGWNKNCYMLDTSAYNESCFHSSRIFTCSYCCDCLALNRCELCYECRFCDDCFRCLRSSNCINCRDCWGCVNMYGCNNCFGCSGLQNAQYCIFNKQYTRDEYEKNIVEYKNKLIDDPSYIQDKSVHASSYLIQCENSSGNNLLSCKNCVDCFASKHLEDCAYVTNTSHLQDCWDIDNNDNSELNYQIVGGEKNYHCGFCDICRFNKELWYCSLCMYCEHCFGCVGLKRKSYCIFNKQYTPETYEQEVAKIVLHMQHTGEWGKFFDASLTPFAYNETVAYDLYPLEKNQCETSGYVRYDEGGTTDYTGDVLTKDTLPSLEDSNEEILRQAIQCSVSGKLFRLTKQEIDVYKKLHISLPHIHPNIRNKRRIISG